MKHYHIPQQSLEKQQGLTLLLIVLVLLVVLTTIVTTASRSTLLETRMTTNFIDNKVAYNAANAATQAALDSLGNNYDLDQYINNSSQSGFYDLRSTGTNSGSTDKQQADWDRLVELDSLDNPNALKTFESPFNLNNSPDYLANNESMKLANNPSYAIGIHDPFYREGTEGVYCTPVSIIGASSGGIDSTLSMIEVKTIPKAGCFRSQLN